MIIGNINIRHIKTNIEELKILLSKSNQVDVLGLCETFLNKSIDSMLLQIVGHTFERKDRNTCNEIRSLQAMYML